MPKHHTQQLFSLCLLLISCRGIFNFPHNTELLQNAQDIVYVTTDCSDDVLITLQEHNTKRHKIHDMVTEAPARENTESESLMDTGEDDLIFAVKKPQQQPNEVFHQIDLLTSAEEDSLTATAAAAAVTLAADAFSSASLESEVVPSAPHEIELRRTTDQHAISAAIVVQQPQPIDMSDFLALIPVTQVKSIVANYYRNDAEVQRAYTFLHSHDFVTLKEHIIAVPEMFAFLQYLNNTGLDVVAILNKLSNLFDKTIIDAEQQKTMEATPTQIAFNEVKLNNPMVNEVEKTQHFVESSTLNPFETTTATTAASEQLNGLHGLVDSILDILPQDQILTTFFDKLETNEQFAKLMESFSSAEFANILSNLQNSVPLRNLIYSLHNNGIYIIKIVDSLKSYFFLG